MPPTQLIAARIWQATSVTYMMQHHNRVGSRFAVISFHEIGHEQVAGRTIFSFAH
jgi:hypothetical protein